MKGIIKAKADARISKFPKRQQLYYIYRTVMNRRNFEYHFKHLISYFLLCRNRKKNEDLRNMSGKRDLYLNKAIIKLKNDLDIVKLLSRANVV